LTFDTVWGFLRSTGFIYPEKEAKLASVMPLVRKTFEAQLARPNRLSKSLVFRRDEDVVAHISGVRAYKNTYFIQHLGAAKRRENNAQIGRMLVLGMCQYWDLFPDLEWLNVNFRPNNSWPQKVFGTFAARIESPQSKVRTYSYMTAPTSRPGIAVAAPVVVTQATEEVMPEVEAHLLATLGALEFQAFDLSRRNIHMGELGSEYREQGLARSREVWAAHDSDGLAGYALLEISSVGLNLSELLSSFRVFMIRRSDVAKLALIERARQRYAEVGRPVAVALLPREDEADFTRLGFEKTKEYTRWIWHRSLLRKFFEHVERVMSSPELMGKSKER
jgi:hypothetical protein